MIVALQKFRTYHLALDFHQQCKRVKLEPGLRDQLRRASQGIVLTLGEGSAKPTARDRARYYSMALGSFRECQVILCLSGQTELCQRFDPSGASMRQTVRWTAGKPPLLLRFTLGHASTS